MARYQWVYKDKRHLRARVIVMQRDNGVCQSSKNATGTECHHKQQLDDVTANRMRPDVWVRFSPDNMEMLCPDCHKRIDTKICADDVIITADGEIIPRY
jgi:5-methylcytosine-specific restriction endonuclease McrA